MQNHKRVQYMRHNTRVWYPISDLLHLRNDVLIGYAYSALVVRIIQVMSYTDVEVRGKRSHD